MENTQSPSSEQQNTQSPSGEQQNLASESGDPAGFSTMGVILVIVGLVALFRRVDVGLGWLFGLGIGIWLVYLGVTRALTSSGSGQNIQWGHANWLLVVLGLLIGVSAISSVLFTDTLIFPIVVVLVGAGILLQRYMCRRNRKVGILQTQ